MHYLYFLFSSFVQVTKTNRRSKMNFYKINSRNLFIIFILLTLLSWNCFSEEVNSNLPVIDPVSVGADHLKEFSVTNLFSIEQLVASVKNGNSIGLLFDLTGIKKTLGNRTIDTTKIYGDIYTGPYPFEKDETDYSYKRFRSRSKISKGIGYINISYLLMDVVNSEGWIDKGTIIVKFVLYLEKEGEDEYLGNYEARLEFKKDGKKFIKVPSIIEGPMIHLVNSDDPSTIVISFKTSDPVNSEIFIPGLGLFMGNPDSVRHEIKIKGLEPDSIYRYRVRYGENVTNNYKFRTAPSESVKQIVFAYTGDSRAGITKDDERLMGVNHKTMERLINLAYQKNASLLLQGGDMINGYTSSKADFQTQLHSWKNSLSGFWRERPVYTCIGNHEALINEYILKNRKRRKEFGLDKWPYATESAEAVIAEELVHFRNGPEVSDKRRPTYSENVYSFRFGFVKFIVFNNNYWRGWMDFGGSPEGFIFDDQLNWIKKELDEGEKDPKVKYIILFAQEPVFPNGGHVKDCMWYYGNNDVRGAIYFPEQKKMVLEKKGIIEVRNELVRMIDNNKKVAAVLGSDEHAYHKTLINNSVPIGKPGEKDNYSPLSDLKHSTWYIVSGGAGAPYYSEESSPWNKFWKGNKNRPENNWAEKGAYYYSSQENIFIFDATSDRISMTVFNPYGEKLDFFPNLLVSREN